MSQQAVMKASGLVALLALAPAVWGPGDVGMGPELSNHAQGTAGIVAHRAPAPGDTLGSDAPLKLPHGERLHYSGRFGVFGDVGEGTMTVENGHTVRDRDVVRLDFDFEGRAMLRTIADRTTSWVDPGKGRALRYHKDEKHPLGSRQEEVEIFVDEGRWEDRTGAAGELPTSRPLDELSFIYLVRGLRLEEGEVVEVERHFDRDRNPVEVEGRGTDTIEVPAGEFPVDILEMRVRDEERFNGGGRIVLYLAHDEARTPVRIESKQSRLGTLVLRLEERSPAP